MKISIVRADNQVYVDGRAMAVDLSSLPSFFHAIQWDDAAGAGWIEYSPDAQGRAMPNTPLGEFGAYRYLLEAWESERVRVEAEAAERQRLVDEAEEVMKAEAAHRAEMQAKFEVDKAARLAREAERRAVNERLVQGMAAPNADA